MKIAIGLPAYNEEKNIGSIIAKLKKKSYNVIVCDDGSSDNTKIISEEMGCTVISHVKNKGYGSAIRSLFNKAKEENYDILVTFDSDGQHSIDDIERVLQPIIENKSDIIIGSRLLDKAEKQIPKYRKIGIKVITKLTTSASNQNIKDSQSGFRAYNKKSLEKINPTESGMGVSTEIIIKANSENLRILEIPINVSYEGDTSTHNPAIHGVSVILSTMKFISLEHPLKFYGIPGVIFLLIGLFFIVWTLQEFTISRKIITNIALIAAGSTIIGTIFMMTSIILYSVVSLIREQTD
jgi:glycosyltransferase involved in cell wall biosynthesis